MKACTGLLALLLAAACSAAPPAGRPAVSDPGGVSVGSLGAPLPPVPAGSRAAQGPFLPDAYLRVCNMTVSNAPVVDDAGWMRDFHPLIVAPGGIILASAPANTVCLSSGFGTRYGRPHEGLDLLAQPAVTVYSAGPGIVREAQNNSGYGLQVLIDHGGGVYTRYAHLRDVLADVTPGLRIGFGQPLGTMGRSGNATAVHLHYEILTGEWGPRGSWGLTPVDPLSLPPFSLIDGNGT